MKAVPNILDQNLVRNSMEKIIHSHFLYVSSLLCMFLLSRQYQYHTLKRKTTLDWTTLIVHRIDYRIFKNFTSQRRK